MDSLIFQYLVVNFKEILLNGIPKFAKVGSKGWQVLNRPSKIA